MNLPHRDAPIEVTEECGLNVLGQLVALDRLVPIMIRSVQRVPHRPHHQSTFGTMHVRIPRDHVRDADA
jgi:hypothetical protein